MEISDRTVEILKNFSNINTSLEIEPGNILKTVNLTEEIFAEAEVAEQFPVGCAIYDLPRFLRVLSTFDNPKLKWTDKSVTILSAAKQVKYILSNPDLLRVTAKGRNPALETVDITFQLEEGVFKDVMNTASIMELPNISIESNGKVQTLRAMDLENDTSDIYATKLGESTDTYKAFYKKDSWLFMPQNYDVSISREQGFTQFSADRLKYLIAVEAESELD